MSSLTFDLLFDAARRADSMAARRIQCPECGGEGRISYQLGNDPRPLRGEWCEECGGEGEVERERE